MSQISLDNAQIKESNKEARRFARRTGARVGRATGIGSGLILFLWSYLGQRRLMEERKRRGIAHP